jgi:hypothetical protein
MQQFFNTMKNTEKQLQKENEDMKYKMREMMIIYKNELDKINYEMALLNLEMKNKEKEMEETKTVMQKLQKERSDLIYNLH